MDVRVCGPNLRDQSKGSFHVHVHDCGDLKHYGPGGKYGGDRDGMNEMLVKNATVLKVVYETYPDQIAEAKEANDFSESDYVQDFWFAPCCETIPYSQLDEYEMFSLEPGDELDVAELQRITTKGYIYFRQVYVGDGFYNYICAKNNSINELTEEEANHIGYKCLEEMTS